jgi:hypothetical protein
MAKVIVDRGMFRLELRFFERFDRGARVTRVTMPPARYLATRKILKILRIEIENYSHHHDNGNVSENSMRIYRDGRQIESSGRGA